MANNKPKTQSKPPPKVKSEVQPNRWLPWLSLGLTLAIALGGWAYLHFTNYFELIVDKQIDTKLLRSVENIEKKVELTNDKLVDLGQRVAKIEGKLEVLKIQNLAAQPNKKVNAKQASEILNIAKKEGTRLDPQAITTAGQEFISAGIGSSDPDVWKTGLAFLDYRSFLNAALAPPTNKFASHDKGPLPWKFIFSSSLKAADKFRLLTGPKVPAERAAVMEPVGSHLNVGEEFGFEFLLMQDFPSDFKLDGSRLKNIIFMNSKIVYEGGPVEMENVYFVNCTFAVSKKTNGRNFATSVLASAPATTFQAGG